MNKIRTFFQLFLSYTYKKPGGKYSVVFFSNFSVSGPIKLARDADHLQIGETYSAWIVKLSFIMFVKEILERPENVETIGKNLETHATRYKQKNGKDCNAAHEQVICSFFNH